MKRTLTAAAALLLAACADNRASIEILGRAAPSDETKCTYSVGGEFLLGTGLLDVGGAAMPNYRTVLYVKNNLADPADVASTGFTTAKDWSADAAKVRINPSDYLNTYGPNPALLNLQAENVLPLDGMTAKTAGGETTQHVELVSGALGAQLATQVAPGQVREVVLGVALIGHTLDGATLSTNEWFFGLKVCNGCLAVPTCPAGTVLTLTNCFSYWQDSAAICATAQ